MAGNMILILNYLQACLLHGFALVSIFDMLIYVAISI